MSRDFTHPWQAMSELNAEDAARVEALFAAEGKHTPYVAIVNIGGSRRPTPAIPPAAPVTPAIPVPANSQAAAPRPALSSEGKSTMVDDDYILDFYRATAKAWREDSAVRAEFRNRYGDYFASAKQEFARKVARVRGNPRLAHHVLAEIESRHADQEAALKLLAGGAEPTAKDRDDVSRFATQWAESADIRGEFQEFTTFAAYMRARESGRLRQFGRS